MSAMQHRPWIALSVVVALIAAAVAAFAFGAYNFAADAPHSRLVSDFIDFARERSVAMRAEEIHVPELDDAKKISQGARHYTEMCTGCHLAPGAADNEMRRGMYPKPPILVAMKARDPKQQFWIVKHGLKMSGMPAWGITHSDDEIWAIVAFLQKIPQLSPAQYRALTTETHEEDEHEHGGTVEEPH